MPSICNKSQTFYYEFVTLLSKLIRNTIMGLEYSIYHNDEEYYEVNIPVASYNRDEGVFLNATVQNHWRGFNDESFSWRRIEDQVFLYDDEEEKIIDDISSEEFEEFLNTLNNRHSYLEMCGPIINILKTLQISDEDRVSIGFY